MVVIIKQYLATTNTTTFSQTSNPDPDPGEFFPSTTNFGAQIFNEVNYFTLVSTRFKFRW